MPLLPPWRRLSNGAQAVTELLPPERASPGGEEALRTDLRGQVFGRGRARNGKQVDAASEMPYTIRDARKETYAWKRAGRTAAAPVRCGA